MTTTKKKWNGEKRRKEAESVMIYEENVFRGVGVFERWWQAGVGEEWNGLFVWGLCWVALVWCQQRDNHKAPNAKHKVKQSKVSALLDHDHQHSPSILAHVPRYPHNAHVVTTTATDSKGGIHVHTHIARRKKEHSATTLPVGAFSYLPLQGRRKQFLLGQWQPWLCHE
jgi:hypothetical protein